MHTFPVFGVCIRNCFSDTFWVCRVPLFGQLENVKIVICRNWRRQMLVPRVPSKCSYGVVASKNLKNMLTALWSCAMMFPNLCCSCYVATTRTWRRCSLWRIRAAARWRYGAHLPRRCCRYSDTSDKRRSCYAKSVIERSTWKVLSAGEIVIGSEKFVMWLLEVFTQAKLTNIDRLVQ